jgi:hypothetical protein
MVQRICLYPDALGRGGRRTARRTEIRLQQPSRSCPVLAVVCSVAAVRFGTSGHPTAPTDWAATLNPSTGGLVCRATPPRTLYTMSASQFPPLQRLTVHLQDDWRRSGQNSSVVGRRSGFVESRPSSEQQARHPSTSVDTGEFHACPSRDSSYSYPPTASSQHRALPHFRFPLCTLLVRGWTEVVEEVDWEVSIVPQIGPGGEARSEHGGRRPGQGNATHHWRVRVRRRSARDRQYMVIIVEPRSVCGTSCARQGSTLTPLDPLLVHDPASALPAPDGLPRLDLVVCRTVYTFQRVARDTAGMVSACAEGTARRAKKLRGMGGRTYLRTSTRRLRWQQHGVVLLAVAGPCCAWLMAGGREPPAPAPTVDGLEVGRRVVRWFVCASAFVGLSRTTPSPAQPAPRSQPRTAHPRVPALARSRSSNSQRPPPSRSHPPSPTLPLHPRLASELVRVQLNR